MFDLPSSATPPDEGGIFHLFGNVKEIVVETTIRPENVKFLSVGGSFFSTPDGLTKVTSIDAEYSNAMLGFRCAMDG